MRRNPASVAHTKRTSGGLRASMSVAVILDESTREKIYTCQTQERPSWLAFESWSTVEVGYGKGVWRCLRTLMSPGTASQASFTF